MGCSSSFILSYLLSIQWQSRGIIQNCQAYHSGKYCIQWIPQNWQSNQGNYAILQHPLGISFSPTQILFHRTLHDFTAAHPKHYELHKDWILSANQWEMIFSQQKTKMLQTYYKTKPVQPVQMAQARSHLEIDVILQQISSSIPP